MASCYDCIHCGVCSDAGDSGFSYLKEDVSGCKYFENKADFVSKKVFERVRWERVLAFEQLKSYGVGFCENKELVEVKRGEWIEDGYNDIPCVCSYCGAEAPYEAKCKEKYDYDYDDSLIFMGAEIEKEYIKTPYCPNCGADMRSVTDCHELEDKTDSVKVVRCKDCIHYHKDRHICKLFTLECEENTLNYIFNVKDDDYCAKGE